MDFLVGAAGLDEGHQLALVVGGAAAGDDLGAVRTGLDGGLEGLGVPQLDRIDRLDVVMAVEEHVRRIGRGAVVMGDDHRVAGRVPHGGVEADIRQLGDEPFGGLAAIGGIGGIGGNGGDADEIENPHQAVGEVLVDTLEDGIECQAGGRAAHEVPPGRESLCSPVPARKPRRCKDSRFAARKEKPPCGGHTRRRCEKFQKVAAWRGGLGCHLSGSAGDGPSPDIGEMYRLRE
jgi:hypothetical protein